MCFFFKKYLTPFLPLEGGRLQLLLSPQELPCRGRRPEHVEAPRDQALLSNTEVAEIPLNASSNYQHQNFGESP